MDDAQDFMSTSLQLLGQWAASAAVLDLVMKSLQAWKLRASAKSSAMILSQPFQALPQLLLWSRSMQMLEWS